MQYFNRDGKFNFVDENNVFVGYDSDQDCCETASWFVTDAPMSVEWLGETEVEIDWPKWRFDPSFFEKHECVYDSGDVVIFRLVSGRQEKYLHLFNSHNGYYGHGFEMKIGGETVRDDIL